MSNLGKVYEINLATGMKNTYPVVYKNKTKLYCKIYGCDDLEVFYDESYPYIGRKAVSLDTFKKLASENPKWIGNVYVPPNTTYWFDELKESFFSRKITDLENHIKHLNRNIITYKEDIKLKHKKIADTEEEIKKTEKEIKRYEVLREEHEKEKEESSYDA